MYQPKSNSISTVVNLKEIFGSRYRISREDGQRSPTDPWALLLPCRFGHIFVHGGKMLGASTNCSGRIAKRLKQLDCVEIAQDGDDGVNVIFDIADFSKIAAIICPRVKRKLSAAHSKKFVEAGQVALEKRRKSKSESDSEKRQGIP